MENRITIPQSISQRIDSIKFPLIIMIVTIHAKVPLSGDTAIIQSTVLYTVQILLSDVVALCAVPLFFVISGYLLFSRYTLTRSAYLTLLRRRVSSLLIPYFLYNFIVIGLFFVFQQLPVTRTFFNAEVKVADYTLLQFLSSLSGIGGPSAAYHLWFIKHLFVLMVLSPILFFILCKAPIAGLIAAAVCYCGDFPFTVLLITPKSLFFFYAGGYCAVKQLDVTKGDHFLVVGIVTYLCIVSGAAWALHEGYTMSMILSVAIIISGMVVMWIISAVCYSKRWCTAITATVKPYYLFIYIVHLPLLNFVQKILIKQLTPLTSFRVLIIYGITIIFTVAVCLAAGYLLRRCIPKGYSLLVGGRG